MFGIRTDLHGRRRARLVAAPVGVVALVSLAACGTSTSTDASAGSSGSAPTSAASDATAQDQAGTGDSAMAAFRSCMAENGVTLPERPSGRGNGTPPQGGTPPSGAPTAPGEAAQGGGSGAPGGGGSGRTPGQAPPGVDATKWAAARKACADVAPTPPGGAAGKGAASSTGSGT